MKRLATVALVGMVAGALWLTVWPQRLGGYTTYVTTAGSSMTPGWHAGDLVAVRRAAEPRPGDVAAYYSHTMGAVVLHRVLATGADGLRFKGDNNDWVDPDTVTADDVIGTLWFTVPQGGVWLDRLTSPPALAALAFLLVLAGGTTLTARRRRRRRAMAQHATRAPGPTALAAVSPAVRVMLVTSGCAAIAGAALAVAGWRAPTTVAAATTHETTRAMVFSYQASVPPSAAYQTTTVRSPQPVFRTLADTVSVTFAYTGPPGEVTVSEHLSTSSGWQWTIPLATTRPAPGTGETRTVTVDLDAVWGMAKQGARASGVPVDEVSVTVVPSVTGVDGPGDTFAPQLPLRLTPTTLALAGGPDSLYAKQTSTTSTTDSVARTVGIAGITVTAEQARVAAAALLVLALLMLVVALWVARRMGPVSEAERIRRRHAHLLVEVRPMPTPAGRPVVDVADVATLVRLAERYGLLVLHWERNGTDTFVVQDEGTTYRYRPTGHHAGEPQDAAAPVHLPQSGPPQGVVPPAT